MQILKFRGGQKEAEKFAQRDETQHAYKTTLHNPTNQISGFHVKNFLQKEPKTCKNANFDILGGEK